MTWFLLNKKFTKELLLASGIKKFIHVVTPLPPNTRLSANDGTLIENLTLYRSLVGKLNFLTNTRPNFIYTVQSLSQFMQNPRFSHWKAQPQNYVFSICGQGIKHNGQDKVIL